MIISRTPTRISFFGGGTDYPVWYSQHGGEVLSTTINKYSYITIRYLPKFFEYNFRIRYYNINFFWTWKKMKKEVFVRFANEGVYYSRIMIDPKKIEKPMIFTNEVFFNIDGIRVSVKKEDWEELQKTEEL